jgi:hypothetical protein
LIQVTAVLRRIVLNVRIRLLRKQPVGSFDVSSLKGLMKSGPAIMVLVVDVCSLVKKAFGDGNKFLLE